MLALSVKLQSTSSVPSDRATGHLLRMRWASWLSEGLTWSWSRWSSLGCSASEWAREILSVAGFQVIRTKGSHHFLRHPDGRATVIPAHSGETIGPGLAGQSA